VGIRRSIVLAAAFAGLLLLIGASAFAIWMNAKNAQERVAALHELHMQQGTALNAIRANVYLNGVLTRDYLLDSDPTHAQQYVDQFNAMRDNTERSFKILEASSQDDAQRQALKKLHRQVDVYWDPTEVVLDWSPEEKRAQRAVMLRQRVRKRQEIFALAAEVERLITENFTHERQRITSADQEFRYSLGWTTAIALLLGMAIAGITIVRMLTLERQSQAAESELRRLTGQIRTAQEQERKFLSRELHDQVGQMLTGLRMELAGMARTTGDPEPEQAARIARAKGTVEQTLRIVRNIAMLLRPSMLDDLGLTPAIAWLVKEVSRSSGVEIRSDIDPALDSLPDAYRTCVYRIVQEALTNALRHSGARNVHVTLNSRDGCVVGAITDDGRGFEKATVKGRGLGLIGMEERVRELAGTIRISATPGRGTTVEFRLPVPPAAEDLDDQDPDRGRSRDRSERVEASA
jgi:signal transduction histidine kinase